MKRSAIIFATVSALVLTGIASTRPAEARRGFGPGIGIAGGLIAGAAIAGAASSAYAWAPGYAEPVYGYEGYGPGYYYGGPAPYGYSYGGYDQSQHGGQPYVGR